MARHRSRAATVDDLHTAARSMPHVTEANDDPDRPIYQVGGKSFVFFRTPRPDAVNESGHRYDDVVVLRVPSEADKQALVQDPRSPFFTTAHFDGHPSVLLRTSRIGEISVDELTEIVTDAWLSRASARRARDWLAAHGDS